MGLPDGLNSSSYSDPGDAQRMSKLKIVLLLLRFPVIFIFDTNCFNRRFYEISGCCRTWNGSVSRIATLEFDRDRKSMGVIVNSKSGRRSLLVKVIFLLYLLSDQSV